MDNLSKSANPPTNSHPCHLFWPLNWILHRPPRSKKTVKWKAARRRRIPSCHSHSSLFGCVTSASLCFGSRSVSLSLGCCSHIYVDLGLRYLLGCLSAARPRARRFASRHARRSLNAAAAAAAAVAFLANVAVPSAAAAATTTWRFVSLSIDAVKWGD